MIMMAIHEVDVDVTVEAGVCVEVELEVGLEQ